MMSSARIPRLKRPLLAVCFAYIAVIFALLNIFGMEAEEPPFADKEPDTVSDRTVVGYGIGSGRTSSDNKLALLEENIRAEGVVARKETRANSEGGEILVCYIDIYSGGRSYRLECYMAEGEEADTGAGVAIEGTARLWPSATNPGEFDSAGYYRVLGIACRVYDTRIIASDGRRDALREWIYRSRRRLAASLSACLDDEDAGVMRAMLLGDRSAMDGELKALYQRSGIIHVLAISGLHISLLGMGLFKLLGRTPLPRAAAALISTAAMLFYGELCGASSSAVRATIMFFIHITAIVLGRSYDMLTALALAAAMLVTEQPLYLNYSGFLLSFLAVLGIGAVAPAITPAVLLDYIPNRREPPLERFLKKSGTALLLSLFSSLSVSLVTLPVFMWSFHTFAVYSVLLNVLILPLMSAVLGLGLLCMLAGLFIAPVGEAAGAGVHLFLKLFKSLCLAENALPGAVWVTGHAGAWQITVYYIMLAAFVAAVRAIRDRRALRETSHTGGKGAPAVSSAWLRAAGAAYLALSLAVLSARPYKGLKITVLDVGQGDGIVIEGGGVNIMIDGGSTSRSGVGDFVLLPFLKYEGISRLDAAVITHEDEDHINGVIELLEDENSAVRIENLILPAIDEETRGDNYKRLIGAAEAAGVPVSLIARGNTLTSGALDIVCLGPERGMSGSEPNAASTVLYLSYGDFSALFTGDVEGAGEDKLNAYLRDIGEKSDIDVLKVAHHGSRYTTDENFLRLTKPEAALISCGRSNRYGHPHEELLERLEDIGAKTVSTAESGAITCETDGEAIEIYTFIK